MGEIIASRRKANNMTQVELAQKLSVTDKAVSKWERNLSCPDIGSIPKLAQALDITVEELLQAKPTTKSAATVSQIIRLILRAVSLAMGIAVVVCTILGEIAQNSAFIMLGIGLFCLATYSLDVESK